MKRQYIAVEVVLTIGVLVAFFVVANAISTKAVSAPNNVGAVVATPTLQSTITPALITTTSVSMSPTAVPFTPTPNTPFKTLADAAALASIDQPVIHPSISADSSLIFKKSSLVSQLSQAVVLKEMRAQGVVWAGTTEYAGKQITSSSAFGLATFGRAADASSVSNADASCAGWIGLCNVPEQICKDGLCTFTGKTITRLVDRPMWLVDFRNVTLQTSGGGCVAPCIPSTKVQHMVYAMDAETRSIIVAWGYTEQ